jgi:hypothetical protein
LAGLRLFGATPFVYTVKSEADYNHFLKDGVAPIFDECLPRENGEVK